MGGDESPRYQPFYCEENVWWLAQAERFGDRQRWVVFISNDKRQCPMWQQRAAPPGGYVVWDYHVVLLVDSDDGRQVWDLDSRLGMPLSLDAYLAQTFAPLPHGLTGYAPRFRVVPVPEFLERFTTDRSHMRDEQGRFVQPPPPWPAPRAPGHPMSLMRFVDMQDDIAGRVVDLDLLRLPFE